MKIYDVIKNYEGLGYAEPDMEDVERRAREAGAADGEVDGYSDGYESGKTDADYSKKYLTIEALSGGTFYVRKANIGYSVNGGEWETTTGTTTLTLNQGDTVRFRGTSGGQKLFSGNTLAFETYGNIESLEYGDDFVGQTRNNVAFGMLFYKCTGLVDASNLVLPATNLYNSCYNNMFSGCRSLTTAPELPATTLAIECYQAMFADCTSLITAPELPATTLVMYCYAYMFRDCASLNSIKCLATDISAASCTYIWLQGVSSTGTFETPSTTDWTTGINGIPEGWTRVDAE